jgi:hypothetical protein
MIKDVRISLSGYDEFPSVRSDSGKLDRSDFLGADNAANRRKALEPLPSEMA